MAEFTLKGIIPSESDAKGIYFNSNLFFASNTDIHKVENTKLQLFTSCKGTVKMFVINRNNVFIATQDRIYMNYLEHCIGTLKRSATAITCNDEFLVIGNNSILEVWHIPKEYKFTLFKMHSKHIGHYKAIKQIQIVDSNRIITVSQDLTVRMFDLAKNESKILASLNSTPVGLHIYENKCIVTCSNGHITIIDYKSGIILDNLQYSGNLLSSSLSDNFLAIVLTGIPKIDSRKEENSLLLPDVKKTIPEKIELSKNSTVIILKDFEEIFKFDLDHLIEEISLRDLKIAVKSKNFIGILDIQTEIFSYTLDLPKILTINGGKTLISAGCADRAVRIYNEGVCVAKLFDEKSDGEILNTHISSNTCIAIYKFGYISSFNISDKHCYRSFSLGHGFHQYSCSQVSDDGCFLFISDLNAIYVIDMQRSKLVDTLKLKSAILSMAWYKECLYTVEIDKTLSKHNIFTNFSTDISLEKLPTGISAKNDKIMVSTNEEIIIYDLDLVFLSAFRLVLEGRNRSEMYSKSKPVEHFDFNSKHIFCGGQTNKIKVIEFSLTPKDFLVENRVIQEIQVSKNTEWENYKVKLSREKTTEFDKKRYIEVKRIVAFERKFYVLSRENVSIYGIDQKVFNPIEFSIKATPDYILNSLEKGDYLNALVSSLQLKDFNLAKMTVDQCKDADFIVNYTPRQYISELLGFILMYLKEDPSNLKLYEFINRIVFYNDVTSFKLYDTLHYSCYEKYDLIRSNYYLIKSAKESKKK